MVMVAEEETGTTTRSELLKKMHRAGHAERLLDEVRGSCIALGENEKEITDIPATSFNL